MIYVFDDFLGNLLILYTHSGSPPPPPLLSKKDYTEIRLCLPKLINNNLIVTFDSVCLVLPTMAKEMTAADCVRVIKLDRHMEKEQI